MNSLEPELNKMETLTAELTRWNRRYDSITKLEQDSIPWVQVLDQFSDTIPDTAWLRVISLRKADTYQERNFSVLMIKGSITGEKLVAQLSIIEFLRELERSLYLSDVYLQSTDENSRFGQQVIDFAISARLLRRRETTLSKVQLTQRV